MKIWNLKNSEFVRKIHLNQTPSCIHPNQKQSRQGRLSFGADGFYEGSFEAGIYLVFFTTQKLQHLFVLKKSTPGRNEWLEPPNQRGGWLVCSDDFLCDFLGFQGALRSCSRCFWGIQGNFRVKKDPNLIPWSLALDPIFQALKKKTGSWSNPKQPPPKKVFCF